MIRRRRFLSNPPAQPIKRMRELREVSPSGVLPVARGG